MTKLQRSMTTYIKAISKRNEGDDKEKTLSVGHLGSTMVAHGEDFDSHSEYGQCLTSKMNGTLQSNRMLMHDFQCSVGPTNASRVYKKPMQRLRRIAGWRASRGHSHK